MSSRVEILNRIKETNVPKTALPEVPLFSSRNDITNRFIQSLEANHVDVVKATSKNLEGAVKKIASSYKNIVTTLNQFQEIGTIPNEDIDPHQLKDTELAIIQGDIGIAENGAIWVPEEKSIHRVLSFITQHVLIIVDEQTLVSNMHEGYTKIKSIPGFGVFVAGPSKTADIEQSLVVGAHGPKRMTVILLSNK